MKLEKYNGDKKPRQIKKEFLKGEIQKFCNREKSKKRGMNEHREGRKTREL